MNLKLVIPIALVSALCLTVGFRFLIATLTEPEPTAASVAASEPPSPAVAAAATVPTRGPEAEPPPATVSTHISPAAAPPEPPTDPNDLSQTDVPVTVQARRDIRRGGIEAVMVNLSSEPMTVDVMATNAAGRQSSVQVSVQPRERKNLADMELNLAPADNVTVHSPPFRDRHVRVP